MNFLSDFTERNVFERKYEMTDLIKYVIWKCYKTLKNQILINVEIRNEIFLKTRIYFNFNNFLLRKVSNF